MKKFFTLIAFTSALIPALQGMENSSEQKNLKRTNEAIDLTGDALDNSVNKKQKTEGIKTVASGQVVMKMVDWRPVNQVDAEYRSRFSQGPRFTQAAPKKTTRKKEFICPRCETAFLSQKNLDTHNTYSYCGNKS